MLGYVLDLVKDLKIKKVVSVLGYRHTQIRPYLAPRIKIAIQKKLLGTADAVRTALKSLRSFKGTVLVLYADNPLLKKETIAKLLKYHIESKSDATLLTAQIDKPAGYGRIMRDRYSSISGIVEEGDADDFQKGIKEINTGIICFNKKSLALALKYVRQNKHKKEYYLTDIISVLYKKGYLVDNLRILDVNEARGVNSRSDLARCNSIMRRRINEDFMQKGVNIIAPDSTFISFGTKIGRDSTIYPFTVIERGVRIGKRCSIGPFVHLREGAELKDEVVAGNFLEIVRSKISSKTLMKHFSYIGDSRIGAGVNIGAGTVTANFDGKKKNITTIKDGAFIGSDTVLVAPVKVGRQALTGAGSVIARNKNVADKAVVVGVPARPLRRK